MARQHTSFIFSYLDEIPINDLAFQGAAAFGEDGSLSLTRHNVPNSVGLILHTPAIQFSDAHRELIFDTTVTFQINHTGEALPADGIAFFIAPVDFQIPQDATRGSLAIFDTPNSNKVFAVEFATKDGIPRIGIDLGSRETPNSVDFKDYLGKKVTAFISYSERRVTVVAVTDTDTFRVSREVNLKLALNQYVQVGISASTRDFSEDHFLYSWSFASALVRENE